MLPTFLLSPFPILSSFLPSLTLPLFPPSLPPYLPPFLSPSLPLIPSSTLHSPTISDIYRSKNLLENFGQMMENIFLPLFEVTLDPDSHPNLYKFLNQVRM